MIEPWQLAAGLVVAASVAVVCGVYIGYYWLGHALRGHVAHWRGEAAAWKDRALVAESLVETLEPAYRTLKENAAVTARMQPAVAVLADRLADAEEALAELKGGYSRLRGEFNGKAAAEADRIAEARVADLHERLLQYSRELAAAAVANAELRVRCGEDSDLDGGTDLV